MNGVISNGLLPVLRSWAGSITSVNCTWQLGHHESTWPACASLPMVLAAMLADTSVSPVRSWITPQQWVGPPITL